MGIVMSSLTRSMEMTETKSFTPAQLTNKAEAVRKPAHPRNFDKLDPKRTSFAGKRRTNRQWVYPNIFPNCYRTCEEGYSQAGDTNMVCI